MSLAEAWRTVVADSKRCKEKIIPVVVHFSEEWCQTIAKLSTAIGHSSSCSIWPHIVFVFQGISFRVGREINNRLFRHFATDEDVKIVLTYFIYILRSVRPSPVGLVIVAQCCFGNIIPYDVRMESVYHRIDEWCLEVQTEVWAECQSFDRLQFYKCIAEYAPVVEIIVTVVVLLAARVLAVGHAANRTCENLTVLLVYRNDRRHLQRILHRVAVYLRCVSKSEILANSKHLVQIPWSIQSCWDILEISIFQYALIILVA